MQKEKQHSKSYVYKYDERLILSNVTKFSNRNRPLSGMHVKTTQHADAFQKKPDLRTPEWKTRTKTGIRDTQKPRS